MYRQISHQREDRIFYADHETRLCRIRLIGNEKGLCGLLLDTGTGRRSFAVFDDWIQNTDFFSGAARQLSEYFEGKRKIFDIKLNPRGTDFQKRVWKELRRIPHGETRTYKEIARAVGNEKASRAVGMASGRNPVPVIIPCHRVIGSSGHLTGFAHGLAVKERLLRLENSGTPYTAWEEQAARRNRTSDFETRRPKQKTEKGPACND